MRLLLREDDTAIAKSRSVTYNLEQIGREVYYAASYIRETEPAMSNLKRILEILGVDEPNDVGLSNSVLLKEWERK
jgi:hypothetical protein